MSFKFRKRIKIVPGFAINLQKGWPSLSIGDGSTIDIGRRGPRTQLGTAETGTSWHFGGHRYIHKAIQAQADVRAVHAQGTSKAVRAQADIIAITKRMEALAKRLERSAAGNNFWKKAAIEQAQLLDRMLTVAKASENDQLVAAVQKCHHAWGDGNPHYRAALDSGLTIADCLAAVLAGKQSEQSGSESLLKQPETTESKASERVVRVSSTNRGQLVPAQKQWQPCAAEVAIWPVRWKAIGRNLVLPMIGFIMGAATVTVVFVVAAHKTKLHPRLVELATPLPKQPAAMPASRTIAATPIPETQVATPTPQPSTSTASPVQIASTPSPRELGIQEKALRKRPTHNSTRQSKAGMR
jgi:hypothetical protein